MANIYASSRALAIRLIDLFANDNLVTHESFTAADDGAGGLDETWTAQGTFKAAFIPSTGDLETQGQRIEYHMSHRVYAKYADGGAVTTKDRFLFRGKYYRVHSTMNVAEADALWIFDVEEGEAT